ncbi:MAG: uroporphyrinogen-III C-methyltransferase [Acidobacteria bacterium RIFCSPLOWO2_02_FULL_68_18]|nr:MAG: uroporphyrinogen-III C-methyltransferase [Acidobacteria bacterium RIFCSPLOWO2_02_FULL_68_18]OFW49825.1 MAG: uroporphyrinogen-III C-methyltransferase [Acidobacteria bacterium RIFCSPLOWO2_12_FULL_68_19]
MLQQADVVLYDSLVDRRLVEDLDAELVFVGKRCGRHSMPQEAITELLVRFALEGKRVARLKGGDPTVFGRTGEEALRLAQFGIPFEIVPGVSSAVAAPALAGMPITHRGLADGVSVLSAHRQAHDPELSIPPYHPRTTLVLLMALQTVETWSPQLLERGYPADLPVAFVSAGATTRQRVVVTTVSHAAADALAAGLESPTLAVVGRVVGLREKLAACERSGLWGRYEDLLPVEVSEELCAT